MNLPDLAAKLRRMGFAPALFAGAGGIGLAPAADGDLFWHLAAGREMWSTHGLLASDPFSAGAAGRPWIDVHWLFQLASYGAYRLGGLSALVFAKCLLVGVGALLLFAALAGRREATTRALFVTMFLGALFAARHLLLVRPVVVTLVFLAFFFLQLERFRREGRWSLLLPLPFVQILWANCQGLFALGPALVAAYAIGAGVWSRFGERPWYPFAPEGESPLPATGRFRRLAALFALCLAGSCVTPYGLRAFALPVKLLARLIPSEGNVFAANVAENVPPFAIERLLPGQFWHLKWFLGLLVLSVILSAGRMLLSHMLLVLGFVGLALIGNRNVLLLYWMATPIAAINLAPALRRALASFGRHRGLPLFRWASRSVVASLLLVVGTAAAREPPLSEPAPFRSPVESARVIESLPGQGTIFAADHHGGYLIWSLYPRYRPYIDTRLVLRSPEEFAEYLNLAADPERFDAFQRRHDFAYVVLPVGYPDRYLGLIAHLYGSRDWKLIFTDGAETLFAPRAAGDEDGWDLGAPATTDRVLARARKRFGASPRLFDRARIQLATLDTVVGKFREAERVLAEIHTPEAEALRARCRFASGDLQTAEEIGEQLLKADGNDVRSLDLLAMVHARRGELRHAAKLLRRALAVDPFDGEATSLLASMEEHRHENR